MTDTSTDPRNGSDLMRAFLPASPFVGELGIELQAIDDDGNVELRLPYRPGLATVGEMVHGGAIATLVDVAAMASAWAGAPLPEKLRGATVSLSLEYVDAAHGEDLVACAELVRRGRSLATCEVTVLTADGARVIAKGLVAYKLG